MTETVKVCADIPKSLHEALTEIARRERRSLRQQLAIILEEYVKHQSREDRQQ